MRVRKVKQPPRDREGSCVLRGADTRVASLMVSVFFRAGQLYIVGIYVDSTSRNITFCASVFICRWLSSAKAARLVRCLVTTTRLDTRRTDKMCVYKLHPTPAMDSGTTAVCRWRLVCPAKNKIHMHLSPLSTVACRPLANHSSCIPSHEETKALRRHAASRSPNLTRARSGICR